MSCDPSTLINAARCHDSCIPMGMMLAVAISGLNSSDYVPPTQQGILSDEGDFILDDLGNHILPDVET